MLATSRMTGEPRSGALHGRRTATRDGDPRRQEKLFAPRCTTVACAAAPRPSPPQCRGPTPLQSCSPTAEPHQGLCQLPPPPRLGSQPPQPPCPLPPQRLGRHPPPCPGGHPQPQPHLGRPYPSTSHRRCYVLGGESEFYRGGEDSVRDRGEERKVQSIHLFLFFLSFWCLTARGSLVHGRKY